MEDFKQEVSNAKASISNTQAAMLGTIRDKLQMSLDAGIPAGSSPTKTHTGNGSSSRLSTKTSDISSMSPILGRLNRQSEVTSLLDEAGFSSIEELLYSLQQSEEKMFSMFNSTQEKNDEMEKLQLENKRLENEIQLQVKNEGVLS